LCEKVPSEGEQAARREIYGESTLTRGISLGRGSQGRSTLGGGSRGISGYKAAGVIARLRKKVPSEGDLHVRPPWPTSTRRPAVTKRLSFLLLDANIIIELWRGRSKTMTAVPILLASQR